MACLINRNKETGAIENVLAQKTKTESVLFNQLREKFNDGVALLIWGATYSPTFKNLYGEARMNEQGEPQLQSNDKYIWFNDKEGNPLFVQDIGSDRISLKERSSKDIIIDVYNETSPDFDWENQPLSALGQEMFENGDIEEMSPLMKKIYERHKSVWTVLKHMPTELKSVTYKSGTKERHFLGTQQLTGVGFNDDGLAQGLMGDYNHHEWDPSQDYAYNKAQQLWDNKGRNEHERIEFQGEFLNKEEFIATRRERMAAGSLKGKVIHLYDEWNYATTQRKEQINSEIQELIKEYNATQVDKDKHKKDNYMSWVKDTRSYIDEYLGLSPSDIVIHELELVSPELGIKGSIDKFIVRPDGTVTIRDVKTSERLLQEQDYLSYFKYSDMEATPLNKAKVQVMLYALAVGLKDNKIRFSQLGVDMLSSLNTSTSLAANQSISKKDAEKIITMLNKYFREESKNPHSPYRHVWDNLKDNKHVMSKLLNPNDVSVYVSAMDIQSISTASGLEFGDFRNSDTIEKAVKDMQYGMGAHFNLAQYKANAASMPNSAQNKWLTEADRALETFLKTWSADGQDPSVYFKKDISFMNLWVGGTTSNVRNDLAKVFNEYTEQQNMLKTKEHSENLDKFMVRFMPVLNGWMRELGKSEFKSPIDHFGFISFLKKDLFMSEKISELWERDFYKYEEEDGVKIKRQLTGEELRKNNKQNHAVLQDFIQNTYDYYLAEKINDNKNPNAFVYDTATYTLDLSGRPKKINHIQVMNGQRLGDNNKKNWDYEKIKKLKLGEREIQVPFFARVAMLPHEKERKMKALGLSQSKLKKIFVEYFTDFWTKNIPEIETESVHVPLRFLGDIGDNADNYSKDIMWQFMSFSENITNKKYMDTVYALGEAMATHLDKVNDESEAKDKIVNLSKFLRAQAKWQATKTPPSEDQVLNIKKTTESLFRVPIKIQNAQGGYDEYALSLYTLISGLKNYIAHTVMGLNFVGAFYNAFQAVSTSVKTATTFTAGSYWLTGASREAFDYSVTDVMGGYKEWLSMQETAINGDLEKSKLFLIARSIKYIPNTLEHFDMKNGLMTMPWKFKNPSSLFFAHTSVEEMNAYSLLYAQLQIPVTCTVTNQDGSKSEVTKPFYEWYEVKTIEDSNGFKRNEVVWTENASRGKYYLGGEWREAKGITVQESIKLKRVYERLQGNYRSEEKSLFEMSALGSFFMQFKRFLPSLIRGQFQSRGKDSSLGKYEISVNEDGEKILEWKERMITGKYRLFTELVFKNFLHKIPILKNQNIIALGEQVNWNDLSLDEQATLLDGLVTLSLWMMFFTAGAKAEDDEGSKDSLTVLLNRLADTTIQSWSLVQTVGSTKNLTPVGVSVMYNTLTNGTILLQRLLKYELGFEDSIRNEQGNIPGAQGLIRNIPYMRSIEEIRKFTDNWNKESAGLGAR